METDYQEMYNNLTVLLQDICQFLSSDKLASLSHRDKKLVESLITRSKVQLQEIAKVEILSTGQEYVDMEANKVCQGDGEKHDIYSSVEDVNKNVGIIIQEELYPYIDLPAKIALKNVKCGFISMRRKFLLGFEKMKRVYATIHNQWLLIYFTDRDTKPICTFNLKNYEAKQADGCKSSNFELINTESDGKVYYFMALTPKDMLQWVVHINRCHDTVVVQSKELDLSENNDYDRVNPVFENHNKEISTEDIYIPVDEIVQSYQVKQKKIEVLPVEAPPLPERTPQNPLHWSDESLASYTDIEELNKPREENLKYTSSEDDDAIYQQFYVKDTTLEQSVAPPKDEITERINQPERSEDKDTGVDAPFKIEECEMSNSSSLDSNTRTEACNKDGSSREKNHSFVYNIVNDFECNGTKSENRKSTISEKFKAGGSLSPPVIKKVPVLLSKPKIKDKPFIGKPSAYGSYRQITSNHQRQQN